MPGKKNLEFQMFIKEFMTLIDQNYSSNQTRFAPAEQVRP
jgi:hypothetical protein